MNLTAAQRKAGEASPLLTRKERDAILSDLDNVPGKNFNQVVGALLSLGGDKAKFVRETLGRPAPERGESPSNKMLGSPQTK